LYKDPYDYDVTTDDEASFNHFIVGLNEYLSLDHSGISSFLKAIKCDPQFVLALLLLARQFAINGKPKESTYYLELAVKFRDNATKREQGIVNVMQLILSGDSQSLNLALSHIQEFPRDIIVLSQVLGPFGLLAFSGTLDWRERNLKIINELDPLFPSNDWWFMTTKSFIYAENGNIDNACLLGEEAWGLQENGNCAHTIAHVHYESGSYIQGRSFINECLSSPKKTSNMEHHLRWHDALLAIKLGKFDEIINIYSDFLLEFDTTTPLEYLADNASLLWYCIINDIKVPDAWLAEIYNYTKKQYPEIGFKFVDMHRSMMSVILNNQQRADYINEFALNDNDDLCMRLSKGFMKFYDKEYNQSAKHFSKILDQAVVFGGSNAQRNIIIETYESAARKAQNE